jgi:hypothetical protein
MLPGSGLKASSFAIWQGAKEAGRPREFPSFQAQTTERKVLLDGIVVLNHFSF